MAIAMAKPLWGAAALALIVGHVPAQAQTTGIDFGKDVGEFARDGECDDPRFVGEGMTPVLLTDSIGRDASDCSAAMRAGRVSVNPLYAEPNGNSSILFGDDASQFANDGECDDIRFFRAGSAEAIYIAEDVGHDATDCKAAFEAGDATWQGHLANPVRGITAEDLEEKHTAMLKVVH